MKTNQKVALYYIGGYSEIVELEIEDDAEEITHEGKEFSFSRFTSTIGSVSSEDPVFLRNNSHIKIFIEKQ